MFKDKHRIICNVQDSFWSTLDHCTQKALKVTIMIQCSNELENQS